MANKILRAGQSRLILEAQLKSTVLRRMIADSKCKVSGIHSVWDKALAVFHLACQAYRIEQRLLRIPARIAKSKERTNRTERIITSAAPLKIKECLRCKVVFFNSSSDYCAKHTKKG